MFVAKENLPKAVIAEAEPGENFGYIAPASIWAEKIAAQYGSAHIRNIYRATIQTEKLYRIQSLKTPRNEKAGKTIYVCLILKMPSTALPKPGTAFPLVVFPVRC